jgi:hypothetical protein
MIEHPYTKSACGKLTGRRTAGLMGFHHGAGEPA